MPTAIKRAIASARGVYWLIDRWRRSGSYVGLTLEQQGAYRNLIDEAALRGGLLPDDDELLARACGDPRRWPKIKLAVLARFNLTTEGYRNATLDQVLREAERRRSRSRTHGKQPAA